MGTKLYNSLAERIKTINDFKSFKKYVKFLVLNNSWCSFIDLSIGDMSLYLIVICISYTMHSITFY